MAKQNIKLEPDQTRVAQWETKGNDWLVLYKYESAKFGTVYAYKGNGCGGGLSLDVKTDPHAISEMERGWNGSGRPGAGQAFVLKCDRPSLKRVFG